MKHHFKALFLVHLHLKSPIFFENSFGRDLGTPSSMLRVVVCAVCMLYVAVCCRPVVCSCIELIVEVIREISSMVILCNCSIDDRELRLSPNRFFDRIGLLIRK